MNTDAIDSKLETMALENVFSFPPPTSEGQKKKRCWSLRTAAALIAQLHFGLGLILASKSICEARIVEQVPFGERVWLGLQLAASIFSILAALILLSGMHLNRLTPMLTFFVCQVLLVIIAFIVFILISKL